MENDYCPSTSVHTKVSQEYRISSIWRCYSGADFEQWAWETFVWKRVNGKEQIDHQPDTLLSAEAVMKLHAELYYKITNGLPYEESEESQ